MARQPQPHPSPHQAFEMLVQRAGVSGQLAPAYVRFCDELYVRVSRAGLAQAGRLAQAVEATWRARGLDQRLLTLLAGPVLDAATGRSRRVFRG